MKHLIHNLHLGITYIDATVLFKNISLAFIIIKKLLCLFANVSTKTMSFAIAYGSVFGSFSRHAFRIH